MGFLLLLEGFRISLGLILLATFLAMPLWKTREAFQQELILCITGRERERERERKLSMHVPPLYG